MELLRFLPIAPWLRAPFSVLVLLVVAVGFARCLPLALGDVYENWRRLAHTMWRPGEPSAVLILDRRSGPDRRTGVDRRQSQTPVAVECRSGVDRRSVERRRSAKVTTPSRALLARSI